MTKKRFKGPLFLQKLTQTNRLGLIYTRKWIDIARVKTNCKFYVIYKALAPDSHSQSSSFSMVTEEVDLGTTRLLCLTNRAFMLQQISLHLMLVIHLWCKSQQLRFFFQQTHKGENLTQRGNGAKIITKIKIFNT